MTLEIILMQTGVAVLLGLGSLGCAARVPAARRGWPKFNAGFAAAFMLSIALCAAFNLGWDGGRKVLGDEIASGEVAAVSGR